MVPAAPAGVSTKNCCLNVAESCSATSRVSTSAVPPAAKVLTMRTGRDGHSSAGAGAAAISAPATVSAAPRCLMGVSKIPMSAATLGDRSACQQPPRGRRRAVDKARFIGECRLRPVTPAGVFPMAIPKASQALARFTVLDLTRVRSGPTCVRQLADWGANVIKIEMPPDDKGGEGMGGPREGGDFQNLHRNKRSMTLNLKSKEGRAAFLKMVKKADVIVENFRPDVKRRLKIDYKDVAKVNPKIVYGSISGLRQNGPYEGRPGFDQIAQGMGGLMSITGLPGQ